VFEYEGGMNEIEGARGKDARREVLASNLQRRAKRSAIPFPGDGDEFRMDVDGDSALRDGRIHVLQAIARGAAEQS
jgi:hypothetical protein